MAGGPSTAELAIAVSESGGLGFLAAGYRSADEVRSEIERVRAATDRPFGVNVFVPREDDVDDDALRDFVGRLGPLAGEPRWDDDDWPRKLALLREAAVPVVSFTFGPPPSDALAALRAVGTEVWVTVTSPAEARAAASAGADALVVQGVEAGGHQGAWQDTDDAERLGLLALLRLVAAGTGPPLRAARRGGGPAGPASGPAPRPAGPPPRGPALRAGPRG